MTNHREEMIMAYVSTEMSKAVRAALKSKFKGMKFSVRKNAHSSKIYIAILESSIDLSDDLAGDSYAEINHYWLDNFKHADIYKEVLAEVHKAAASVGSAYYDHSDSQSDYFNCAYYYSLSVGEWDKPYKVA